MKKMPWSEKLSNFVSSSFLGNFRDPVVLSKTKKAISPAKLLELHLPLKEYNRH